VLESMFGLNQRARTLSFNPCLPSHWPQAELTLLRDTRRLHFILMRATPAAALTAQAPKQAQLLMPGQWLDWTETPCRSGALAANAGSRWRHRSCKVMKSFVAKARLLQIHKSFAARARLLQIHKSFVARARLLQIQKCAGCFVGVAPSRRRRRSGCASAPTVSLTTFKVTPSTWGYPGFLPNGGGAFTIKLTGESLCLFEPPSPWPLPR